MRRIIIIAASVLIASSVSASEPSTESLPASLSAFDLSPAQSIQHALQYDCAHGQLIVNLKTAGSPESGQTVVADAKIVVSEKTINISDGLTKAIKGTNILTQSIGVSCGSNTNSFVFETRTNRSLNEPEENVRIVIASDGGVSGFVSSGPAFSSGPLD